MRSSSRSLAFAFAFAFALVAGCVTPGPGPGAGPGPSGWKLPVALSKTFPGAEPVISTLPDGTLFAEGIGAGPNGNINVIYRSTDDGATWSVVTPPFEGEQRSNDGFVATGNGGSVYAANVFSTTFQVFRSDDKGASWTPLAVPHVPVLMHRHWIVPSGASTVFVVVEALPPGFASYLAGQKPPQDVTGTPNEGLWYFMSTDKGTTWSVPAHIDPLVNFAGQGNLVVSPDGKSLYVPRYEEASKFSPAYKSGKWYLLSSHDGGSNWKRTEMFALTSELSTAVPALSMDGGGTLYFAWSQQVGNVSRAMYAFSKDQGVTWSTSRAIPGTNGAGRACSGGASASSPDGCGTNAMVWAIARGSGELHAIWYTADVANGTASQIDAPWFIDSVNLTGADTDAPTGAIVRLTLDPVHQGNICARGPACSGKEDRRLLDYPWMTFGPDGRTHVIFPSTKWDHPSAFAFYAGEPKKAA